MEKPWSSTKKVLLLLVSCFCTIGLVSDLSLLNAYSPNESGFKRFVEMLVHFVNNNRTNDLLVFVCIIIISFLFLHASQISLDLNYYIWAGLGSLILSLFIVIGISFRSTGSLDLITASMSNVVIAGWKVVSYFLFFLTVLKIPLSFGFDKFVGDSGKITEWKLFGYAFVIILLAWLVYIIILFPGTLSYDTTNQLSEFFGKDIRNTYPTSYYLLNHENFSLLSDHHPLLLTLFYGFMVKIGLEFGSSQIGLFLASLSQTLYTIIIFAYSLIVFKRLGVSKKIIRWSLFFYAFFPLFPVYSLYLVKNTAYSVTILWFSLLLLVAIKDVSRIKTPSWDIALIVNLFLQVVLSKYGFYVAVVCCLGMFIAFRKQFKRILLICFLPLLLFKVIYGVTLQEANITPGDPIEAYALPMQQTARYIKEYPHDVTASQEKVLNKVFYVKNLSKLYVGTWSDPVKSSGKKTRATLLGYRYKTVKAENIKEYRKVWGQMFFKHPDVYMMAFLNQMYGYLDLNMPSFSQFNAQNLGLRPNNFLPLFRVKLHFEPFSYKPMVADNKVNILGLLLSFFILSPGIGLLFRGTTFLVLTLITFMYQLILRKYQLMLPLLPILIQAPICFISPLNASQRYMFPFIFSGVFIVILGLLSLTKPLAKINDANK